MNMEYIEIDGWSANIRFSSAHIIPEYNKCGRLHGHTYAIHAKIYGKPSENGIIVDFRLIKNILKSISETLDHRMLIPSESPIVKVLDDRVEIVNGGKIYIFPKGDCAILPIKSTSAENIAAYILDEVIKRIKDENLNNVEEIEIGVDEGFGQGARVRKKI